MVQVYFKDDCIEIPLETINEMTGEEVIKAVMKQDVVPESAFLARRCRPMSSSNKMSTVGLVNGESLRILHRESDPVNKEVLPTNFSEVQECREMLRTITPKAQTSLIADLSSDTYLRNIMLKYPQLKHYPEAVEILSDYFLVGSYIMQDHEKAVEFRTSQPLFVRIVLNMLRKHTKMELKRPVPFRAPVHQSVQAGSIPSRAPHVQQTTISADMLSNALASVFGAPSAPPPAVAAPVAPVVNPTASQSQQLTVAQQSMKYAAQLMQLNEFGFLDLDQNLAVLESTGGDVQRSLELLIVMREDDMMQ